MTEAELVEVIPCQYCGRTAKQIMATRAIAIRKEGERGIGKFEEKDGLHLYTCIDCQSKGLV